MNSYRLNGVAGHYFRMTVAKYLNIHWNDIYRTVKSLSSDKDRSCIVETKDGKKYELILKEIKKDE